jgi:hypothetical protein
VSDCPNFLLIFLSIWSSSFITTSLNFFINPTLSNALSCFSFGKDVNWVMRYFGMGTSRKVIGRTLWSWHFWGIIWGSHNQIQ